MNVAIEIFKILAAMSDHRPRKRRQCFRRNFNRTGYEELIVWDHQANVQCRTRLRNAAARQAPNVQCRMLHFVAEYGDAMQPLAVASYASFLIKLMSPLRSTRAIRIFDRSSVLALSRRSSSRSCLEIWFRLMASQISLPSRTITCGWPLIRIPNACERQAIQAKKRWKRTKTNPQPSVGKNGALPLIVRASADARITRSTASKTVFSASDRLLPIRIMARAEIMTMIPRNEI